MGTATVEIGQVVFHKAWDADLYGPVVAMTEQLCVIRIEQRFQRGKERWPDHAVGKDVASSWDEIFALTTPSRVASEISVKEVTTAESPTLEPPELIRHVKRLTRWSGVENPESSVYFLCRSGEVVYVGQTKRFADRMADHEDSKKLFDAVYFVAVPPADLNASERSLIRLLKPQYNRTHKR